jgi:hypothetical protein
MLWKERLTHIFTLIGMNYLNMISTKACSCGIYQWWLNFDQYFCSTGWHRSTSTSDLNWTHWTQKDHSMWRWKSKSWLEQQAHKCGGVKSINGIYCKLNIWTNILYKSLLEGVLDETNQNSYSNNILLSDVIICYERNV